MTVPLATIQVVNVRVVRPDGRTTVYIGRSNGRAKLAGSVLANPYRLAREADRGAVLARYETWLDERIAAVDEQVLAELDRLVDIARTTGQLQLACWCDPKPCHGGPIRRVLLDRLARIEPTEPCREEHAFLLRYAAGCELAGARLDLSLDGADRAQRMLTETAAACRRAAEVFALDPTLADEPRYDLFRHMDVLNELARQLPPLLRNALSDQHLDRWPRQARWDEAGEVHRRACELAELIHTRTPRRDHDTVAGCQAISRGRIDHHRVREAAKSLRVALSAVGRLPHPAPEIAEVERLAGEVEALASHLEHATDCPA